MQLTQNTIKQFQKNIWSFFVQHGREFDWRNVDDPYKIVVSEIMLQQTQTYRVAPKYTAFIKLFPHFQALAQASLKDVLAAWQGLGYNRRAKYIYQIAHRITSEYNGILPDDPVILQNLPGIGPNTAGSICAFAFNKSVVFIETNIRAVFLDYFFKEDYSVDDKQLLPLIKQTVDHAAPRQWYYALMDYGVFLKQNKPNPNRQSKHYTKQSRFEGSDRQIRGAIIALLTKDAVSAIPKIDLIKQLDQKSARVEKIIKQLIDEELISIEDNCVLIK